MIVILIMTILIMTMKIILVIIIMIDKMVIQDCPVKKTYDYQLITSG